MIVVEYQKIELDHCPNCKGTWFDAGELELLLGPSRVEARPFIEGILASPPSRTAEARRRCPVCGRWMKKGEIGAGHQLLLDGCRNRHGLWFDGGEVGALVRHLSGEHDIARPDEEVIRFLEEVLGKAQQQ